jgi:acyl-CoA thioester hydrolase
VLAERPPQSSHSFRVRFFETDLMGIVHHAAYLTYFEAGRVDYLHKRGVRYDSWVTAGIHLPVVEANARYRRAAKFDDRLEVVTSLGAISRVTVRFDYRVQRGEELLCEGFTLLACVGHDLAPKRFPEWVSSVLTGAEKPSEEWT